MTEHSLSLTALAQSLKDGNHSIFSASGSSLWMNCPGGLIPNLLADDDSGAEAAEGTVAHGVGETWLRSGVKPTHLIGTKETVINGGNPYEIEITLEMLGFVQDYVDMCAWLPGKHFVETKVYYSRITPLKKQGGTADHVACRYQHMCITDFKYGKGVEVLAKNNTQGMLYALGFFYEWDWLYDFQTIEIRICQPRKDNIDSWTITREQLLAFADEAKVKAFAAWKLGAPRNAGEKQCQFCRVKGSCAAHFHMQAEITGGVMQDLYQPVDVEKVEDLNRRIDDDAFDDFVSPYKLTTARLAKVYSKRSMFESWWKSLHNELGIRAAMGEDVPGMKLVEARTNRVIVDEERAQKTLMADYGITRKELIIEKMQGITAIQSLLRKKGVRGKDLSTVLDPLVRKPSGKPTLVVASDPRPALVDLSEEAMRDLYIETDEPLTD